MKQTCLPRSIEWRGIAMHKLGLAVRIPYEQDETSIDRFVWPAWRSPFIETE
jgi:hypothetical protein